MAMASTTKLSAQQPGDNEFEAKRREVVAQAQSLPTNDQAAETGHKFRPGGSNYPTLFSLLSPSPASPSHLPPLPLITSFVLFLFLISFHLLLLFGLSLYRFCYRTAPFLFFLPRRLPLCFLLLMFHSSCFCSLSASIYYCFSICLSFLPKVLMTFANVTKQWIIMATTPTSLALVRCNKYDDIKRLLFPDALLPCSSGLPSAMA
ncbi:unnamed protein product [Dibothriocephalus latus]|uniref:Uncharacterized protein n=1 Tax=Dibothriocephalus latus TaxID=60516 RepID=A0A3P7P918_DIBLA|nr:unnamed protein product [Dibothriocephalus latus]